MNGRQRCQALLSRSIAVAEPAPRFDFSLVLVLAVTLVNGGPSACARVRAVALAWLPSQVEAVPQRLLRSPSTPLSFLLSSLRSACCQCMNTSCIKSVYLSIDGRPKTRYIGQVNTAQHDPDIRQHIRPLNQPLFAGVVAVVAYTASRDVGWVGSSNSWPLPGPLARFGANPNPFRRCT